MATKNRTLRLGSLLQEVISEVINKDVHNPNLPQFVSITSVEITKDLRHAKVFINVIGDELVQKKAVETLESAAGFIAVCASKKVTMRYFPQLTFRLDTSTDKHIRLTELLNQLESEKKTRSTPDSDSE